MGGGSPFLRKIRRCLIMATVQASWHFLEVSAEAYNPYQYDDAVVMFTPDGRLLQLEYARMSADHSAPIFVLPLRSPSVVRDAVTEDTTTDTSSAVEATSPSQLLAFLTYRPSFRLQQRLLVYEKQPNGGEGFEKVSMLMGMAGIVADCGALGRKVLQGNIQHQEMFGTPFTTARQWAMYAGQCCQVRALGGGIRPFGANLVFADVQQGRDVHIFITDPSGAIQFVSGAEITTPVALIGGGFVRENKLKRDLVLAWPDIVARAGTETLADQLARVFQLIESGVRRESSDRNEKEEENTAAALTFEVVLVSPQRGIFKLTPTQIKDIRSRQATLLDS